MCTHRAATLAVVLVLLCALCPAIRAGGIDVRFGLQAGANMARTTYEPPSKFQPLSLENDYRTVLGGGGTISFAFSDRTPVSFESGLLLQMKGGETRMTLPGYDLIMQTGYESKESITWKLLYLSVPVLARHEIRAGTVRMYLTTGMEFDILVSAKSKEERTTLTEVLTTEEDIRDDLTAVDIGLVAGAGVEWPIGRMRPFMETVYHYGLTDIIEFDIAGYGVKGYNRVIGIMAGVRF